MVFFPGGKWPPSLLLHFCWRWMLFIPFPHHPPHFLFCFLFLLGCGEVLEPPQGQDMRAPGSSLLWSVLCVCGHALFLPWCPEFLLVAWRRCWTRPAPLNMSCIWTHFAGLWRNSLQTLPEKSLEYFLLFEFRGSWTSWSHPVKDLWLQDWWLRGPVVFMMLTLEVAWDRADSTYVCP